MSDKTCSASAPVVRFAPSPTGFLHIGGARTALFNWLYAKGRGGTFLLRIEDTDRARNSEEAVAAIMDGLKWLELDWHGEPVSQHAQAFRHRAVANELLKNGHAYRCYLTPAELDKMRRTADAEKRPLSIRSPWRERDPGKAPDGVPFVIRLKTPGEGQTIIDDKVQGRVVFPNKDLDDFIIVRSDGNPTYNLAVVVDDHDMCVTHIIRGVDHLTNSARQLQIYKAMKWEIPVFAHVPLIHGPDGSKLSKRHGALGVEAYRAMGYLPAALRNYLVRLGWSHGNDEIISTDQMINWFDVDAIGRSPARFDFAKLEDLNGYYIRSADDLELLRRLEDILPYVENGAAIMERLNADTRAKLLAAIPSLRERAKTLNQLLEGAGYLFAERPITLDDKAAKLLDAAARARLSVLLPKLEAITSWEVAHLEDTVRALAETEGVKLGKVAQPLRAALTGKAVSPPVFDVMAVLGREEALARIRDHAV
jgi:glutamyl-tRNA synthetase